MKTTTSRHLFTLIDDLARSLRVFQQQSFFCEGLTYAQFAVLDRVVEAGGLALGGLHEALAVDKSTTTRLVQPLVEEGLVTRRRSPADRRVIELSPTPAGRAAHGRVWACIDAFFDDFSRLIPEQELLRAAEGLQQLARALFSCCQGRGCC